MQTATEVPKPPLWQLPFSLDPGTGKQDREEEAKAFENGMNQRGNAMNWTVIELMILRSE